MGRKSNNEVERAPPRAPYAGTIPPGMVLTLEGALMKKGFIGTWGTFMKLPLPLTLFVWSFYCFYAVSYIRAYFFDTSLGFLFFVGTLPAHSFYFPVSILLAVEIVVGIILGLQILLNLIFLRRTAWMALIGIVLQMIKFLHLVVCLVYAVIVKVKFTENPDRRFYEERLQFRIRTLGPAAAADWPGRFWKMWVCNVLLSVLVYTLLFNIQFSYYYILRRKGTGWERKPWWEIYQGTQTTVAQCKQAWDNRLGLTPPERRKKPRPASGVETPSKPELVNLVPRDAFPPLWHEKSAPHFGSPKHTEATADGDDDNNDAVIVDLGVSNMTNSATVAKPKVVRNDKQQNDDSDCDDAETAPLIIN